MTPGERFRAGIPAEAPRQPFSEERLSLSFSLAWPAGLPGGPPRAGLPDEHTLLAAGQLRVLRGEGRWISALHLHASLRRPDLAQTLRDRGLWIPDTNLSGDYGNVAALHAEQTPEDVAARAGWLLRRLVVRGLAYAPWDVQNPEQLSQNDTHLMRLLITVEVLLIHTLAALAAFPQAQRAAEGGVSLRRALNFTARWPHLRSGSELTLLRAAGLDGQLSTLALTRQGHRWLLSEGEGGPARDLIRARLSGEPRSAGQLGHWAARLGTEASAALLAELERIGTPQTPEKAAHALGLIQQAQGRDWSPAPERPLAESAAHELWNAALPPLRLNKNPDDTRADPDWPAAAPLHAWTLLQLSPPVLAGLLNPRKPDPLLTHALNVIRLATQVSLPHGLSGAVTSLREAQHTAQWQAIEAGED